MDDPGHECRFDVSCLGTFWVECDCGRTIECTGCPECYEYRNLDEDAEPESHDRDRE